MRHAGVLRAFARRADKIGIVFMHGEAGAPGRVIVGLTDALEKAGYLVARPDLCRSARQSCEARFSDCLSMVDETIVWLKNLGATAIIVGGFGLSGNAAIANGARHPGLLGIIAVAPGHDTGKIATRPDIADSSRGRAISSQRVRAAMTKVIFRCQHWPKRTLFGRDRNHFGNLPELLRSRFGSQHF
jgi:hypothetical protein